MFGLTGVEGLTVLGFTGVTGVRGPGMIIALGSFVYTYVTTISPVVNIPVFAPCIRYILYPSITLSVVAYGSPRLLVPSSISSLSIGSPAVFK